MPRIIVTNERGFRFLPKPAVKRRVVRVQTPARKASPEDVGVSDDEKTQLILDQIIDEAHQLDDDETRDFWLDGIETFKQSGDIEKLIELTTYRRKVVPLDEFMFGGAYLGLKPDEIYPGLLEFAADLDTDQYIEAVLKGALGYGKSTLANIMLARGIYKTSCMRHPQSTFGIRSGAGIVFTIQSIRLATAKKAVFDEFGNFIKNSPYFKHIYPFDPTVTSQMIFREQSVSVTPVSSSSTGAISMNVLGGVLDEMNFMQRVQKSKSQNAELDGSYSQAKAIYNAIARRRRSRFARKGKLPGLLFLISSSRFPDDFTEQKAAESTMCGGTDPTIYVVSKAVWEVKGRDTFMDEEFRVMIGNNMLRSKILEDHEQPIGDCQVINVPMDFKHEFEKDLDGSLRDFAGVTILSTRPFITRRSAIHECIQAGTNAGYNNPFLQESYNFNTGIPHPIRERLRTDIRIFRTAHVDLGLTRDACGIAIGHIAGQRLIERTDPLGGGKVTELMPVIGYDCILRVTPPPNGEIEFSKIREFLIMLRDEYDIPIEFVTLDGFQSVDSRQILRSKGFKTDYLSVEKIDPYRTLRDALYDNRLQLFPHQFLADELAGLEYVRGNNGDDRVDHRTNGTKDVADAVCGVATFLFNRRIAWSQSFQQYSAQLQASQGEDAGRPEAVRGTARRTSATRRSVMRR